MQAELFGAAHVVDGADALAGSLGRLFDRFIADWLAGELVAAGAGEILLTSVDRDGTGQGYDLRVIAEVAEAVSVPVIASGGAGELDLVVQLAWLQDHLGEGLEEVRLRHGGHVQRVHDLVRSQVLDQRLLERGVVVAVVQSAGAAEEVGLRQARARHRHGGVLGGLPLFPLRPSFPRKRESSFSLGFLNSRLRGSDAGVLQSYLTPL